MVRANDVATISALVRQVEGGYKVVSPLWICLVPGPLALEQVGTMEVAPGLASGPIRGLNRFSSKSELIEALEFKWLKENDRPVFLQRNRSRLRQRFLKLPPPRTIAGWVRATPFSELRGTMERNDYHATYTVLASLVDQLLKEPAEPEALDACKQAILAWNALHAGNLYDEEAGELLLRRMVQVGECAGLRRADLLEVAKARTFPASPPILGAAPLRVERTHVEWGAHVGAEAKSALEAALGRADDQVKSLARERVEEWVRLLVLALNDIDARHGAIETQEREALVRWIETRARRAGWSGAGDVTERWRDW